ncbi:MAG: porin family protein [Sulfurovum sp.]|nr:porin family protein [Sulfurovum sp.]MDD3602134.1 porin family protein [Sulfurovum sp.]
MKKFNFSVAVLGMMASGVFAMAGGDIAPVEPAVEVEMPAVDSWSGPYIGLQAGYNWGNADTSAYWADPEEDERVFTLNGFNVDGFTGGIFAGYNWKLDNDFLIGVEGEYNFVSADDTIIVEDDGEWGAKVEQEWDASLRLRAGKVMGDYMPYITGGIAWAGMKADGWTEWGSEDHYDDTLTGWTIGAGLEKKINENLHARIQYRYTDYGDDTWELDPSNDPDTGKIEYNAHLLMVGLSYRF